MDPAELRRVFQMFDKNGDGQITKKELSDSLKNLGIYIPDKDLIHMIEKIDVNGDGYVDIEEFRGVVSNDNGREGRGGGHERSIQRVRSKWRWFYHGGGVEVSFVVLGAKARKNFRGLQEHDKKGGCGWRWHG
ncbi:hypothetical protein OIU84_012092 [Salix udensis]|uniref:EF-hand domain-containing protein n=1 Tax=Salix udensis TaxID=889485 RepID=A0AAD6NTB2_9ROSI|nr:hypothetical protein OIU84_012092 [Salix udensis]